MSIEIELLEKEKERDYLSFLEQETDESVFQHTLFWQELTRNMLSDEPHYFVVKEGGRVAAVVPTFIRRNEAGNVLNSLPLSGSHGGICFKRGLNGKEREVLFKEIFSFLFSFMKEEECIASTIIMSPFSDSKEYYLEYYQPDFVYDRFTQAINLRDELRYNYKVRNHIRKAIKSGVEVCEDVSPARTREFWRIYKENMEWLGLGVRPLSFFEDVAKSLVPKGIAKYTFAYDKDKMISGLLTIKYRNGATGHILAMDRKYRLIQANSLLLDLAIREAKEEGYEYFNLGATGSKDCGVYKFKRAWGAEDVNYSYFTKLHGDLTGLQKMGLEKIKKEFAWYYVLPYSWFEE